MSGTSPYDETPWEVAPSDALAATGTGGISDPCDTGDAAWGDSDDQHWTTPSAEGGRGSQDAASAGSTPGQQATIAMGRGSNRPRIMLAVASVAVIGGSLFTVLAFDSVEIISAEPMGDFVPLILLSILCGIAVAVSCVYAVWSLVRRRSPGTAVAILGVGLVLTPVAAYVSVAEGISTLKSNAAQTLVGHSGEGLVRLDELAREHGVDFGWFHRVVDFLSD